MTSDMAPDEDLVRVTLFALEHDDFRQAWETAVRDAADRAAAEIAGARMAGARGGKVWVLWEEADIPVPASLGPERTQAAFARAVTNEVEHRIAAMPSPGAFG